MSVIGAEANFTLLHTSDWPPVFLSFYVRSWLGCLFAIDVGFLLSFIRLGGRER